MEAIIMMPVIRTANLGRLIFMRLPARIVFRGPTGLASVKVDLVEAGLK
jgi:hypothetical protein